MVKRGNSGESEEEEEHNPTWNESESLPEVGILEGPEGCVGVQE